MSAVSAHATPRTVFIGVLSVVYVRHPVPAAARLQVTIFPSVQEHPETNRTSRQTKRSPAPSAMKLASLSNILQGVVTIVSCLREIDFVSAGQMFASSPRTVFMIALVTHVSAGS